MITALSFTFLLGIYFGVSIMSYLKNRDIKKYNKNVISIFEKLKDDLNNGVITFAKRLNSFVYLSRNGNTILFKLDKKEISIFEKDSCIAFSSQSTDTKLVQEIVSIIESKYKDDIDDVIYINGEILSKNVIPGFMGISDALNEDDINVEIPEKFNLDDILDKINSSGLESLTLDEKKYLNKF